MLVGGMTMSRSWFWPVTGRSAGIERTMVHPEKEEAILMKQGSQVGATRAGEQDDSVISCVPAGAFWMDSISAELEDAAAACVADGGSEIPCRCSHGAEGPGHEIYLDACGIDCTPATSAR